MAGTRSSTRNANSSSPASAKSSGGIKRKADTSSPATKTKRGRPSKASKEQKTLEETMPEVENGQQDDAEMEDAANGNANGVPKGEPAAALDTSKDEAMAKQLDRQTNDKGAKFERPDGCWFWPDKADYNGQGKDHTSKAGDEANHIKEPGESFKGKTREGEEKKDPEKSLKDSRDGRGFNAFDKVKADPEDQGKTAPKSTEETNGNEQNGSHGVGSSVDDDKGRAKAMPSNILEKGIIYFFIRGRVGVDDPDSVQDLARSYFVLRPLPRGAKLTDGAIGDMGNNRLCALPKKVWPKSSRDKFMVFVEKPKTTMDDLKVNFFAGSEYSTKTTGTRHTPAVTPVGEGVYAITSTGRGESHLAYMLTIPNEIGEVQQDVGLREKGSFVISLKNPQAGGPANAQLSQGADYPKEIMDEFRGRGWMPIEPKHLDYANAQMLLIGEDFDSSSNLEPTEKDEKDKSKVTPQEELEKLEHEDELRVKQYRGDDTVFDDLDISSKEYPKVMTTW